MKANHHDHDRGRTEHNRLDAIAAAISIGFRRGDDPQGPPSTTAPNLACARCRGQLVAAGLPGIYECAECGRVHHQIAGEIEDVESASDERSAVGARGGRR